MKYYTVTITRFINKPIEMVEIPFDKANNEADAKKLVLSEFFTRNNISGFKKLLYRANAMITEDCILDESKLIIPEEWLELGLGD